MRLTQAGVTTGLTLLSSVVATLLPVLVDQGVISAQLAAIVGGVVTSLAAGWHGNAAVVKRQATPDLASIAAAQANISDVAAKAGNAVGAALANGPETPAPQAQQ